MCVYKYIYTISYNSFKSCKVDNCVNINDISMNIIFPLKMGLKIFTKMDETKMYSIQMNSYNLRKEKNLYQKEIRLNRWLKLFSAYLQ